MQIHELFESPLPGTPVKTPYGYGRMVSSITDPETDNRTALYHKVEVDGTVMDVSPGYAKPVKGLHVSVFRWSLSDCTNHGVTSKAVDAILVGLGSDAEVTTAGPNDVVLQLVTRPLDRWRSDRKYFHAEPLLKAPGKWYMAGGNFVYSSDSRFNEATAGYPLAVHDRVE